MRTKNRNREMLTARMISDKRSIRLRQALVCPSTNARLCLVFPSFVSSQAEVCFQSSEVAEQTFQSKGFPDAVLGVSRCCRRGAVMPCIASLRWLYGAPSMVIRDPFDGYTGLPQWKSEFPLMKIGMVGRRVSELSV